MPKTTRITVKQFAEVTVESIFDIEDVGTLDTEPYHVLTRKIETLSELLGCTEQQAQRMLLEML